MSSPVVSDDDETYSHHSDIEAPIIPRGKNYNPLNPFSLKGDECYEHNLSEEGEEVISNPRGDAVVCLECFKLIPQKDLSTVATKRRCCRSYVHKTCKFILCTKCLPVVPKGARFGQWGVIEQDEAGEDELDDESEEEEPEDEEEEDEDEDDEDEDEEDYGADDEDTDE